MSCSIHGLPAPTRRRLGRRATPFVGAIGRAALALVLGQFLACAGSDAQLLTTGKPPAVLALVPAADLNFAGPAAGPFRPALELCTAQNTGGTDLLWSAESSAAWLQIRGPTSGTLRPQASIAIGVAIDPQAARELPAGAYEAELRFHVSGDAGFIARRRALLRTEAAPGPGPAAPAAPASPAALAALAAPAAMPTSPVADSATDDTDAGWTVLSPSPDTRMVYVSSSTGDDSRDGFSPATAKRTIAAGEALLTHHMPDWLLLMRGDVWAEALGQWTKSGRSPTEPMLVSAYGSEGARPLLQTGTGDGVTTTGGGGAPPTTENVAFVGLHFQANGYDGSGPGCVGARILQTSKHLLFEDCEFQAYHTNLVLQGTGGRHEDLRVRRCVIVDAYARHSANSGHPQGLYAFAVDGLLIEENLFDHNGWSASVPDAGPDMFCHNLYLANGNTGVVVRGNIIANASSHGMQLRSGGTATNNLFVQNAIALSVGGGTEPEPSGVTALVLGNVILDGKDIDAANPRGWGVWFGNIAQGEASGNVVAHNVLGRHAYGLTLAGDEQGAHGIHDLRISGNVFYDWGGGILVEGDASQLSGIVVEGNDLQEPRLDLLLDVNDPAGIAGLSWSNNRCQGRPVPGDAWMRIGWDRRSRAQWPPPFNNFTTAASAAAFPEPQRDVPSYCHSLGRDAALATFLEQARAQSKSRWLPEFTAAAVNHYVREGFGMTDR